MHVDKARLDDILASIRQERLSSDTPAEVVDYALRATRKALIDAKSPTEARIRGYFGAVASRRLVKRHAGSAAAARVVAQSVIADLRAAGRDAETVIAELERGWAATLPPSVIEECRERLCA